MIASRLRHRLPDPRRHHIRDYVHVSDLADAQVAAIDWLAAGKPSDSFNLGNGRGFSVAEVVKASEKVTGRSVPTEMCARRLGDPPVHVSDSSKARELLGWTPNYPTSTGRSRTRGFGSATRRPMSERVSATSKHMVRWWRAALTAWPR